MLNWVNKGRGGQRRVSATRLDGPRLSTSPGLQEGSFQLVSLPATGFRGLFFLLLLLSFHHPKQWERALGPEQGLGAGPLGAVRCCRAQERKTQVTISLFQSLHCSVPQFPH